MSILRWAWWPVAVFACWVSLASASPEPFRSTEQSTVKFECFGKSVTKPARGRFATILSRLKVRPDNLTDVRGHVSVELGSVLTDDPTWDVLFRAAPFLGIQEYPRSSFELLRVEGARKLQPNKPVKMKVAGRFRLKDEKRNMKFPATVTYTPASTKGPERIHLKGNFKIRWKDYGVRIPPGSAAGFAGEGTAVKLDLTFERSHY